MVLDWNWPVVWGFDVPGSQVKVSLVGTSDSIVTQADSTGVWRQTLPQMAPGGPYNITFTSSSGGQAELTDVLFGDVYVCGGQSNMQFTVSSALNASAEIAAANNPNIRIFTVGQGTQSNTPLSDLETIEQNWTAATPASIGGGEFVYFSAICWFFGRDVNAATGRPIGLISNNWGGTCLERWAPTSVSAPCGKGTTVPILYNAMIAPYTVGPMTVSGFLWSQGECNADSNSTAYYGCAFGAFMDSWRNAFGNSDAFFAFELLPAYIADSTFSPYSLPYERAAQLMGLNATGANVVVASGLDLGDPQAPHGSVHPRNKQTVGARMSAAALNLVYGKDVPYLNPSYTNATQQTLNNNLVVTVTFGLSTVYDGLYLAQGVVCPTGLGVPASECSWYDVQTVDGTWWNATQAISPDGMSLVLTVPGTALPANATRGNFSPYPVVTLYNSAGLPALPWGPTLVY